MIRIHEKTLKDLEFFEVLEQISEHTITALGKKATLAVLPIEVEAQLMRELDYVNEYRSSFDNDNRIPNHGFETISKEIKLLNIENTYLEVASLQKLVSISLTTNNILIFLEKFKEYYPKLHQYSQHIEVNESIIEQVDAIVDRFGDIKDDASPQLLELRQEIWFLKVLKRGNFFDNFQ